MSGLDNATLAYRVQELEKDIADLKGKVDKLVLSLIGLTLSIAGSAVVFALTVASMKGRA